MDHDKIFKLVALAGFAAAVAIGMYLRFGYTVDERLLPARPPAPPPPDRATFQRTDFTPEMYEAYLVQDAQAAGVPRVSAADLSDPFPYEMSEERRFVSPGDPPVETPSLRLSLRVEKREASTARGTYSVDHLILKVENKLAHPLAYRIDTVPEASAEQCLAKGDLLHNAIALGPNETVQRTECTYRPGMRLRIDRIETVVVPGLAFHYVSRLVPAHIGLDPRATRGHQPPHGELCSSIPQQAILTGQQKGTTTWRDVIDFYGRHRCETYLFPTGYRAFRSKSEYVLPVSAQTLGAPR